MIMLRACLCACRRDVMQCTNGIYPFATPNTMRQIMSISLCCGHIKQQWSVRSVNEWVRERERKREIRWKTDCLRNYCYFCFSLINTFIIIWRRCIFESPLDCNRWQWSTDMLLLLQHTILAERYEQVTNLSASHAPFTRLTGLSFTRKNPSTDRFWLVFAMKCSIRIYCRISC